MGAKHCLYCGIEFETDNPARIYCSHTCRSMAWIKRHEPSYMPKGTYERDCVICGAHFTTNKPNRICCSKSCADKRRYQKILVWQRERRSATAKPEQLPPVKPVEFIAPTEYKEPPFEIISGLKMFICERLSYRGTSLSCGDFDQCYKSPCCCSIPPEKRMHNSRMRYAAV